MSHETAPAAWWVTPSERALDCASEHLQAAGYSYKEIAEKLGVTYTNVNRHTTEGRGELRDAA